MLRAYELMLVQQEAGDYWTERLAGLFEVATATTNVTASNPD
jgi:hypothetical protein